MITMSPCELIACITAISCAIYNCFPEENLPVLAAAFTQLGDSLATMLAQAERCGQDSSDDILS